MERAWAICFLCDKGDRGDDQHVYVAGISEVLHFVRREISVIYMCAHRGHSEVLLLCGNEEDDGHGGDLVLLGGHFDAARLYYKAGYVSHEE